MLFGQQQACLSTAQGVIHWVGVLGLEVCQAANVDAVGDDTDQHGRQYGHVIQHPGLTEGLLQNQCMHSGQVAMLMADMGTRVAVDKV